MVQPLWKTSISSEVKDIQIIQPSSSTLRLYLFMVILFMCACVCAKLLQSCLTLATLQTVACQAPLSMGFSRQEYWSG